MKVESFYSKEDALRMIKDIQQSPIKSVDLNFDRVLEKIFSDIKLRFGFESISLFLLDKDKKYLLPYKLIAPDLCENIINDIYKIKIKMSEEGGMATYIIKNKKVVYLPDINPDIILTPYSKKMWDLTKIKSNLLYPLCVDEAVVGMISFPTYRKKLNLTQEKIKEISHYVNYISMAIAILFSYSQLMKRNKIIEKKNQIIKSKNEKLNMEMGIAKQIQEALIPTHPPDIKGIKLTSFYKPVDNIGGDFFDFIRFKEPNLSGILICDVSGHGVPVALISSMIKTLITTAGVKRVYPTELLSFINEKMIGQTNDNFITAFYGIYDTEKRILRYARGGHCYPL